MCIFTCGKITEVIANHDECYQATISVGVLLVNADANISQLLALVDQTLCQAKKTKNLVVVENCSWKIIKKLYYKRRNNKKIV